VAWVEDRFTNFDVEQVGGTSNNPGMLTNAITEARGNFERAVAALEARTKTPAGRNITPLPRPFDDPLPPSSETSISSRISSSITTPPT